MSFLRKRANTPDNPEHVRYRVASIPEAATEAQFDQRLSEVFRIGLPGFIIRAAGMRVIADNSLERIAEMIIAKVPGLDPTFDPEDTLHILGREVDFTSNTMDRGELHNDYRLARDSIFHIHQTTSGSGRVYLANSGTFGKQIDEKLLFPEWDASEMQADMLFARGLVDPRSVNPNAYSAMLQTGDTIIFPVAIKAGNGHDKTGPVWHRFDTSATPREAELIVVGTHL